MPHFPKPFYRKARRRWYVEINGKQINLGPDQEEAFQQYHELMASPEPVIFKPADPGQPVAALCDRFLEWVQNHRAEPTYEAYRYRLQRFVDRYPELTVDELRPFHAQEWADSYDVSVTSRRNYLRSIKTCLRWCCKQGYIDKNPLQHMDIPAADRKEVYVSPEEFDRILEHVTDPNLLDLFVTTYEIGCRPQGKSSSRTPDGHLYLDFEISRAWKAGSREGYSPRFYARNRDGIKEVADMAADWIENNPEAADGPMAPSGDGHPRFSAASPTASQ